MNLRLVDINLLPYREVQRQERLKLFIRANVLAALVSVGLLVVGHLVYSEAVSGQSARNVRLDEAIKVKDAEISEIKDLKKQTADLQDRKKVVESLQSNRYAVVRLMEQLSSVLPDGVYISTVVTKGPKVTVTGFSQNNALISDLMNNVEASTWMAKPTLGEIQANYAGGTVHTQQFTLTADLVNPYAAAVVETKAKPSAAKTKKEAK